MRRRVIGFVTLLALTTLALDLLARQAQRNVDWRYYSADNRATKYSPLEQINANTITNLKVAWRHPQADPSLLSANPQLRVSNLPAPQDHPGQYSQLAIDTGTRLYNAQCAQCHGPAGDMVTGIDLRLGRFRRVSSDEDLARVITNGVPGTGMPPFALQPPDLAGIVAFIRAGFDPFGSVVKVGDAARGRTLVEGKGNCLTCHRINTTGSHIGPNLSDVGLLRSPAALQRSLTDPTSAMMPINRPVRIVMKNGRTITGRRLNEDTYTVQIIDGQEKLLSIAKSDMRNYTVETKSTMASYASSLNAEELSDVIAYLLTLRGL
jgi:putative heme-binding domain-containing protein